jgi:TolB-like protein
MKQYRYIAIQLSILIVAITFSFSFSDKALAFENEINSLATALSGSISGSGKHNIAVVDFTDLEGNVTKLGRFIAEELSVALLNTGPEFEVVDRTQLKVLMREHQLSASGIIDPATARKLGKVAGVEALITGTITPFGESVRLSVKILDTNTAKLVGAKSCDIPKTNAIEELLSQEIHAGGSTQASTSPKRVSRQAARKPEMSISQVQKKKDFTFTLQECTKTTSAVECKMMIVNNGNDRKLIFLGKWQGSSSRMFDNLGNAYTINPVKMAGCKPTNNCNKGLIAGVPTKASFVIDGVASDASHAAVIELSFSQGGSFRVQFRNVPFISN